jgi:GGDEF domain-containing protein
VDFDGAIAEQQRKHLSALAAEVAAGSPPVLVESRSTLRGLLRDYRDRAVQHLGSLRDQLSSTAQALQEMVVALSECDTDETVKVRTAVDRLRQVAKSPSASALGPVVKQVADTIEESLEQIRKQHQLTITQFQTEMRLLHSRIDTLETASAIDEATKFSNRRFLTEYLASFKPEGSVLLALKLRGLAQARAKYGPAIEEDLLATFGRRLRNTLAKDAVVGRWSEQDFLAAIPVRKSAETISSKKVAEHLSTPYACMLAGKVVRIPLEVKADCISVPVGASAKDVIARVTEAFS